MPSCTYFCHPQFVTGSFTVMVTGLRLNSYKRQVQVQHRVIIHKLQAIPWAQTQLGTWFELSIQLRLPTHTHFSYNLHSWINFTCICFILWLGDYLHLHSLISLMCALATLLMFCNSLVLLYTLDHYPWYEYTEELIVSFALKPEWLVSRWTILSCIIYGDINYQ